MTTTAAQIETDLAEMIVGLDPAGGESGSTSNKAVYQAMSKKEFQKYATGVTTKTMDRNFLFEDAYPEAVDQAFGATNSAHNRMMLTMYIWHKIGSDVDASRIRAGKDLHQIISQMEWAVHKSITTDVEGIWLDTTEQIIAGDDEYWQTELIFRVEYISVSDYNG